MRSAASRRNLPGRAARITPQARHGVYRAHLVDEVSLEQLAAVAGISAHHFAELFNGAREAPCYQSVPRAGLSALKEALRNPQRSVIDAGFGGGFTNPSHFRPRVSANWSALIPRSSA